MATLLPYRDEELRSLKAQVDHIQERLDFILPMMPLVNYMQDYFEKMECEASVQLMRLQKVNLTQSLLGEVDDGTLNAQLETVKWLHHMTDFVMALREEVLVPVEPPQANRHPSEGSAALLPSQRRVKPLATVPQDQMPVLDSLQAQGNVELQWHTARLEQHSRPTSPGSGSSQIGVPRRPGRGEQWPHLVLGNGSWAQAVRGAHGSRQEALRLLCESGIVTARELSDDLTVISDEHIDECVLIAQEMLQKWPLEAWVQQPQEAKRTFEARLTLLYESKVLHPEGARRPKS
mmetsp:Transcript_66140/g.123423  ORF Transcript_66140/g.123423 Transcript_66140/m.123423 type:complete len:291 (+) Transcript_66140:61-933(+)